MSLVVFTAPCPRKILLGESRYSFIAVSCLVRSEALLALGGRSSGASLLRILAIRLLIFSHGKVTFAPSVARSRAQVLCWLLH